MARALASLLLAAATPAAAVERPAGKACEISVTAAADGGFAQAGHDAGPERLGPLAELTRRRFAAAARRLCASGVLRQADLVRFRRLIVQNGEGATEPLLYQDPGMGPGAFIFQYAFQDGGPPDPAAFEQALRCWKRPRNRGCDSGD
jgi:hypothetical protein